MSGFGYWSHDIGGFESTSTPDVYKRWAAFGLLSSHSRLHGSTSYRVPWAYDEEAVDVLRFFTKLKMELLPYIYSSAVETSRTGVPVMRSMVLEFENEPGCHYLDRQYMLGEKLLVAPIFNENGESSYYLPKGTWTNYLTGETYEGGTWHNERHGYLSIPLWVRENTILPVSSGRKRAEDSFAEDILLKVYHLQEQAETIVYQEQTEILKINVEKKDQKIYCHAVTDHGYQIQFVNCVIRKADGAELVNKGSDSVVIVTDPSASIVCEY
jgi:alpha-D-xyloside xylohydrolase